MGRDNNEEDYLYHTISSVSVPRYCWTNWTIREQDTIYDCDVSYDDDDVYVALGALDCGTVTISGLRSSLSAMETTGPLVSTAEVSWSSNTPPADSSSAALLVPMTGVAWIG